MAPNPLVKKAFIAMRDLGIKDYQVKPVLRNLLTVYEKNWELIAEDNFRVLADAIFESQEIQKMQDDEDIKGKKKEAEEDEVDEGSNLQAAEMDRGKKRAEEFDEEDVGIGDSERPLKRLRRRGEGGSALTLYDSSSPSLGSPTFRDTYDEETAPILLPYHTLPTEDDPDARALVVIKDEPITNMRFDSTHSDSVDGGTSVPIHNMEKTNGHAEERDGEIIGTVNGTSGDVHPTTVERFSDHELAATPEESSVLQLASSASGEVKINLSFSPPTGGSNLREPSMDELRRAMEEKCLRSYKILDPNFSVVGFMNDICSCYLDLATKTTNVANQSPENFPFITSDLDVLKKSAAWMAGTSKGNTVPMCDVGNSAATSKENDVHCDVENDVVDDSMGLVVVPECQISGDDWRSLWSASDITLGVEAVEIPWVNDVNEKVPPSFHYIAQSLVYLDAAVKFSLGNIRDDQCCSACFGNCLSPIACRCANGPCGIAYTLGSLLQEDFLEECISEARHPQKDMVRFCRECPLEKAKHAEIVEPCKGHLKRKVIKECWKKCGCIKACGNRVVQEGIQQKLQVFYTSNGKGWGLRTLEEIPKGAFVCEFAGEILTIPELCQRNIEKFTTPVIMDAYWGSEELSGSDKALCLDTTHYGNISRFINHRCSDANLIEIPVHVESMDPHYYHLALFTTRDISAMEELTWDYGVEFNDHVFPTTPFHCQCGSEFCRNIPKISKGKNVKKKKA